MCGLPWQQDSGSFERRFEGSTLNFLGPPPPCIFASQSVKLRSTQGVHSSLNAQGDLLCTNVSRILLNSVDFHVLQLSSGIKYEESI